MSCILFGSLTALLCGFDLWCKNKVEKTMKVNEEKDICEGKIKLRNVRNRGMVLNIGDKRPEYVRILSAIVCGIVFIYSLFTWKSGTSLIAKIGAAFVLSGAISNTYDRLKRKYVVDYFGFCTKWKKFNRITFNLGDIFIFIGAVCCVIGEFRNK